MLWTQARTWLFSDFRVTLGEIMEAFPVSTKSLMEFAFFVLSLFSSFFPPSVFFFFFFFSETFKWPRSKFTPCSPLLHFVFIMRRRIWNNNNKDKSADLVQFIPSAFLLLLLLLSGKKSNKKMHVLLTLSSESCRKGVLLKDTYTSRIGLQGKHETLM